MITLKLKIGNSVIEYSGEDVKKVHKFSAVYGMLPDKCDACGSVNIFLSHKSPGGNDYFGIACKSCGAELNFHQKKEGGFYVKRGEKMEVYKSDVEKSKETPLDNNDKDVPF
jgi:hypothetical protein